MKHLYQLLLVSVAMVAACCAQAQSKQPAAPDDVTTSVYKKNGSFAPNLGQVVDENYQPVTNVLAKSSLPGLDIYLTQTGVTYVLLNYELDSAASVHPLYQTNNHHFKVHYSRVDVNLVGATLTQSQLVFGKPDSYKASYYYGDIKAEAVSQYKDVTVKNVYPGIDWHWFINSAGQPEYDFVVHGGYSSSAIKMQYQYADITPGTDNILISTRNGALREGALKAFAGGSKVQAAYTYNKAQNEITFNIGSYNTATDLVIDPPLTLLWSAQYGGTFADGLRGVATDASNNAYMVGYTTSTNFPARSDGASAYYDNTYNGSSDAIILKVSPNQILLWATYIGGSGNDFANSISISPVSQYVYVTGGASTGFPMASVAYVSDYSDNTAIGQDAFIARFDLQLHLKWSTFYGGTGTDEALKVYADTSYTYVAGYANMPIDTMRNYPNSYVRQVTNLGLPNPFILQFSVNDYLLWATAIPDSASGYATSLVRSNNDIVLGGFTNMGTYRHFGPSIPPAVNHGGTDGFTIRFTNAVPLSERMIGGQGNDFITDATKAVNGAYTIVGRTNSTNYPVVHPIGAQFVQPSLAGGYDAFITRIKSDTISWSTYYGGSANDAATAITTDKNFKYLVTGYTFSNNFPVDSPATGGYYQPYLKGNSDGFIASFTQLGLRTYSTYKGDTCYEYPADVAVTNDASLIYICGEGFVGCNNSVPDVVPGNGSGGPNGFCWLMGGIPGSCINLSVNTLNYACPDSANGMAVVNYTGGIAPYSIEWSNGERTDTATKLPRGETFVTITDSAGCAADLTFNLFEMSLNVNSQPADCNIPGQLQCTTTYGKPPYTYNWAYSLPPQATIQGPPGIYALTVTDTRGCVIKANPAIGYVNTTGIIPRLIKQPYCEKTDGILAAYHQLSGTYVTVPWADSTNTRLGYWDTIYNLAAGMYYIDTNDCVYNPNPANRQSINLTKHNVSPYNNVTITQQGAPVGCGSSYSPEASTLQTHIYSGGNPFTFSWSTGYTGVGDAANYLPIDTMGTYSVTVTDVDGCSASAAINVNRYDTVKIVDHSNISNCMEDYYSFIDFEAHDYFLDSVAPFGFSYYWSTPNGSTPPLNNQPLEYGAYTVTVVDFFTNCSVTKTWYYQPHDYQHFQIYHRGVFCGSIMENITVVVNPPLPGKMHYQWYDALGNLVPIDTPSIDASSYIYYVTVTSDSSNIYYSTCINIFGANPYHVSLTATSYTCAANGVTLNTVAYFPFQNESYTETYQWFYNDSLLPVNSSSYQALQSGQYSIVGQYQGCYDTATINVTAAPLFQYNYTTVPRCNSDSTDIYFNISGGLAPFTGQTQPVTVAAGTYNYTLRDARNCVKNISVTTTHHASINASSIYTTNCNGADSVKISATGGTPPYVGIGTYAIQPGNNMFVVTDNAGCRDTLNVAAIPHTPITNSISRAICSGSSYTFNGQNLSYSGNYTDTLTAINGCDSIVTLNLTVLPVSASSFSAAVCNGYSYTFNNQQLALSGTYTDTLTAINGCDSIVTLNLTVLPVLASSSSASVCNGYSYTFNNQQLTQAGSYIDTLTATTGCDSIVTLNLTVLQVPTSSFSASVCNGYSYTFINQQLTLAGTYTDTLTASGGCDSIVTLNLTVLPELTGTISDAVCDGDVYVFNNQQLTQAGAYTDTLQGINGCDSLVTLILYTKSAEFVTVDTTIQQGTIYTLPGGSTTAVAGTYTDTLVAANGCDSIITTNLTVIAGIGNSQLPQSIDIYPNPASTELYISTTLPLQTIIVYNATGQQVMVVDKPQHLAGSNNYKLDIELLAAGTYVLQLNTNNTQLRQRWVKM